MTDTYGAPKPRRPLVPGPTTPASGGIAEKAIALRQAQREAASQENMPSAATLQAGLGSSPEIFSRRLGPTGKITKAIANVMRQVGTIQMTGYNSFHRYKYPKMEDILPVVTPLMGEQGLVIHQNEIEIKNIEGNRIAVAYEFTVYHESGESFPPARHTGMAIARDSKGNWDDKAVAKCHTNARKFHLQALFEIPLEVPDNEPDDTNANQRRARAPVPGPKPEQLEEEPAPAEPTAQARKPMDGSPYKIVLGPGAGSDQWAGAYIRAIKQAASEAEIKQWDGLNDSILQALSDRFPGVYEQIEKAVTQRLTELGGKPDPMPKDPGDAMNWIAVQLQQFKEYEAAEKWWNETVVPRENSFDDVEWNMLMKEWERTEQRLAPDQVPDPDKDSTRGAA